MNKADFQELKPTAPQYFFVPKDTTGEAEYNKGFSVKELFRINGNGVITAHDGFSINMDKDQLLHTYERFQASERNTDSLHSQFKVKKIKGWDTLQGYDNIENEKNLDKYIKPISYRPFDNRFIFYENKLVCRTVERVMCHFIEGKNVGLALCRQFKGSKNYYHAFITRGFFESCLVSNKASELGYGFPLYLYSNTVNKI